LCEQLFALREFLSAPRKTAPRRTTKLGLEHLEAINAPQDVWSLLPAAGLGVPMLTPFQALLDGFAVGKPALAPAAVPISFSAVAPVAADPPPPPALPNLGAPLDAAGGGSEQLLPANSSTASNVPADPFPDLLAPIMADATPTSNGAAAPPNGIGGGGGGGGGGGEGGGAQAGQQPPPSAADSSAQAPSSTAPAAAASVSPAAQSVPRTLTATSTTKTAPQGGVVAPTAYTAGTQAHAVLGGAIRNLAGFQQSTIGHNDDKSSVPVNIGFAINFYGDSYRDLNVNNNGNVTFGGPFAQYGPANITRQSHPIIAPFWADVDSTAAGGGVVTFGQDVINGHKAFGVDWFGVDYYDTSAPGHVAKYDTFQLVLIDRSSDVGSGAFDIEFNYGAVTWETGNANGGTNGLGGSSARVGYSNGTGKTGTNFELAGSGVAGSFLDSNSTTGLTHASRNSTVPGRMVFNVRPAVSARPSGISSSSGLSGPLGPSNAPPGGIVPEPGNDLVQSADGTTGQVPSEFSGTGVRYYDGEVSEVSSDLQSSGLGVPWGVTRNWSNNPSANGEFNYSPQSDVYGFGWTETQLPYLQVQQGTGTVTEIANGDTAHYFDSPDNGATYQARFFDLSTLSHDIANHLFVLTDSLGDRTRFYDFSANNSNGLQGQIQDYTDPDGNVTVVNYNGPADPNPGTVKNVQRYVGTGGSGSTLVETYVYTYYGTNESTPGYLKNVALHRPDANGPIVRQVQYTYYDGLSNIGNGNQGDLELAVVEDGSGTALDTTYYRYYTDGNNGFMHALKYVVNPESYGRLAAALGGFNADPNTATTTQMDTYADQYFEYGSYGRVTTEDVQGDGGASSGGVGTYTYAYTPSGNVPDYNSWAVQTVETLPDGNTNTVYSNAAGEVLLSDFQQGSGASARHWDTYQQYDSQGRALMTANPAAVKSYDNQNLPPNLGVALNSTGLITTYDYYSGTPTATDTKGGSVPGYLQDTKIQQGQGGQGIRQSLFDYFLHPVGDPHSPPTSTVSPVADRTVYRTDQSDSGEMTSYTYSWYTLSSGAVTAQMQTMTVKRPKVSTAQNGPGNDDNTLPDTETTAYDPYGRSIWFRDADGFLTYTAYDQATGAVVKSITDVNTNNTGDFSNLPQGWSTPLGDTNPLHLITQTVVDTLGRATKVTDPNQNVTYTVYRDALPSNVINVPDHEVLVYPGWNPNAPGGPAPTGPTQVTRVDRPGGYTETLTTSAQPLLTNGAPNGTEPITPADLQTLSRSYTNSAGQVYRTDAYVNFAGITTYNYNKYLGTQSTRNADGTFSAGNYYTTSYSYDSRGRQNETTTPTNTVYHTDFDGLGRKIDDMVGTSATNQVQTTAYVYDNGSAGGDSNLTQVTTFPGGGAANRVTQYFYDWRDRQVASKQGVLLDSNGNPTPALEDTTTHRPIGVTTYDNLGEATQMQRYDGDGVTVSVGSDGIPVLSKPGHTQADLLRAQTGTSYDDQGRVYQTQTYSVDPTSGAVAANFLTTNTYYNHRGQVIETAAPGGLVTKTAYDGAGRVTASYSTDGLSGAAWANAGSVAGDNVLQQTENQYDKDGNVTLVTTRQRFDDETRLGALGDRSGGTQQNPTPKARVSFVASYYDAANRRIATVDVGTNGGTAWDPLAHPTPPDRSDTVLVTSYVYNPAGWVDTVTDPRAIATKTIYDALGRTTKTVEAYDGGAQTATTNKTTEYTYDGSNHRLTVQADREDGSFEQTRYVYGVDTTHGSGLNSNDLLAQVWYPNKTSPGTANSNDKQQYTYDALGETLTYSDRIFNTVTSTAAPDVHTYSYDVLGRQTVDAVTTLGYNVNGAVRRLETAYDSQGNVYLFTSFDAATNGNIVNQVLRQFNGLGQLTAEFQAHGVAVNTSTTPSVQYSYSFNPAQGGANHSRLTSMTDPTVIAGSTGILTYNYASGLDDRISRLTSLSNNGGVTLESYKYLGLGMVVERDHPLTPQISVNLTYIGASNGPAGDKYVGLDAFGRVVDQNWFNTSTQQSTDRFKYGYDRDSNRVYRTNEVNTNFGELYHASGVVDTYDPNTGALLTAGYDRLNQLSSFSRGTLNGTDTGLVGAASRSQSFTVDATGNFASIAADGGAQVLRTNNQQNETTVVGTRTLVYDGNGNTTTDDAGNTLTYDAWNRLLTDSAGTTVYGYDALGRRVTETHAGVTTDVYFSSAWQVVEERQSSTVQAQYVWSPVATDTLVERDRPTQNNERLYVQQDANGNVTALVNTSGTVVERYAYDPYGTVTVLNPTTWAPIPTGSAFAWVYLHQGGRYDAMTGLYNFRHRDESPTLQRWLEVDPSGFGAGDTNFYRDEGNNAPNAVDPSGLDERIVILHNTWRPKENDIGWKMWTPGDGDHYWDLDGPKGAQETLKKLPNDSIRSLYLNGHCGDFADALTARTPEGAAYRALVKAKLTGRNNAIRIYSCYQGQVRGTRENLQRLANETGAVVWARTGETKTPWGGGSGEWIEYVPQNAFFFAIVNAARQQQGLPPVDVVVPYGDKRFNENTTKKDKH
jgi:RHS repeat-associated protein